MFYSGGRIGIYSGDFKDLSRDLPVLQPTVMICVPRILNRLYNRVITLKTKNFNRFLIKRNKYIKSFFNFDSLVGHIKS